MQGEHSLEWLGVYKLNQCLEKDKMDFLKDVLGEELFMQVNEKLKSTDIKLADISKGAYVGREKHDTLYGQYESMQKTLEEANTAIESYKNMDVDSIKVSANQWETKYNKAIEERQKIENDLKLQYHIDTALLAKGARNIKATKALLNMEKIKLDGEQVLGLNDELDSLTKEHDYLFTPKLSGSGGFENNPPPNAKINNTDEYMNNIIRGD